MKIRLLQHSASGGCKRLVQELRTEGYNALRTKVTGSAYKGYSSHLIVNWGRSERPPMMNSVPMLNDFEAVHNASDKIRTFEILSSTLSNNIPKWTTVVAEARRLIRDEHETIYCRKYTRASQGRGIVVATRIDELELSPLYTSKVEIDRELRVHVFSGSIIDYAQKKRMTSETREERGIEVNEDIRSHDNGWIFAREGVTINEDTKRVAIEAVATLGLDFGAVDIVMTPQCVPKVLEVNTAPGLEGTTLESYKNAIVALCSP